MTTKGFPSILQMHQLSKVNLDILHSVLETVTLLRCGFLVTSYPRFFRGTGRGGPDLEWQARAGAKGAQRRREPQALRDRKASCVPVPSAAPMVLAQTWNQGETKVRGAS